MSTALPGVKLNPVRPSICGPTASARGRVVEIQIAGGKSMAPMTRTGRPRPGRSGHARPGPSAPSATTVQVQRADAPVQAPAVALRRVIVKGQPPGIHRRPSPAKGSGDGHLRGARVAAQHHLQVGLLGCGLVVRRQRPAMRSASVRMSRRGMSRRPVSARQPSASSWVSCPKKARSCGRSSDATSPPSWNGIRCRGCRRRRSGRWR